MIFRQLYDQATSTYTYLLADTATGQAILIDSVFEQHARDLALVRELGVELLATVETHVHADHVTGAWLMKEALGSQIVLAGSSGAQGMDRALSPGDAVSFGASSIVARATPGHTDGCFSYYSAREALVFSGDALLIRGAGRTDFQQGSAEKLFDSVREQLFSLPEETLIYPAHDYSGRTVTTVREERKFNPRLGDHVRKEDFVGYMTHLGLPHPKKLDVAVPANLQCGRPSPEAERPATPDWGPVVRTYAGVLQIDPEWVREHLSDVLLLDVREEPEVTAAPLEGVPQLQHLPLSQLRSKTGDVDRGRPVVTVCPSGARSAMAANILEKSGHPQVANLVGGLSQWQTQGLPTG